MLDRRMFFIVRAVTLLCALGFNLLAQTGSGNISFAEGRTFLEAVIGFVLFLAACFCLWRLVMAFLDFRGQDFGHGFQNLIMAGVAAVIVGLGVMWINTLTGQNMQSTSPF